jgi:hypothetical protein
VFVFFFRIASVQETAYFPTSVIIGTRSILDYLTCVLDDVSFIRTHTLGHMHTLSTHQVPGLFEMCL